MMVVGRSLSGKTTQVVRFLRSRMHEWDKIYLISPTASQDTFDPIRDYVTKIYKEPSESLFQKIIKKQSKPDPDRTLLIIDDCAAERETNMGRKGGLAHIANNSRWWNLSVIVISQSFASVTPALRDNAEAVMLFATLNVKEKNYMIEERNPFGEREAMKETYDQCFFNPHDFLFQVITTDGTFIFQNFERLVAKK